MTRREFRDRRCRWSRSVVVPATSVRVRGLSAVVDAAFSSAIVLLPLLVVGVVNTCFLLWICGAMLQHSTCTYVSCE